MDPFWFRTKMSARPSGNSLQRLSLRHFIILPTLYGLLAYGLKKYWLENDLRHLYRDLIKPQYRRYSDELQTDWRDINAELAKEEDLTKSIIHDLELQAEGGEDSRQKIMAAKRQ